MIEDFYKATMSVLLLVEDGSRKDESREHVWKSYKTFVYSSGNPKEIDWRGNFIRFYGVFRKAMKEYLASFHNVIAIQEYADKVKPADENDPQEPDEPPQRKIPVDAPQSLLSKLARLEFQLKLPAIQESNDWNRDLKEHKTYATMVEQLPDFNSLSSVYDSITGNSLSCEALNCLTQVPRLVKEKKRLPNECEGIIHSQGHLKALLQQRVSCSELYECLTCRVSLWPVLVLCSLYLRWNTCWRLLLT